MGDPQPYLLRRWFLGGAEPRGGEGGRDVFIVISQPDSPVRLATVLPVTWVRIRRVNKRQARVFCLLNSVYTLGVCDSPL